MESITRDVNKIEPDERRVYEAVLGHTLRENQQIIIRVIELGVEPDEATRKAALRRATEIAQEGRAAAQAQGITPKEAEAVIEEGFRSTRSPKP
jgi:endonuclease V-like protein UPF0215 family